MANGTIPHPQKRKKKKKVTSDDIFNSYNVLLSLHHKIYLEPDVTIGNSHEETQSEHQKVSSVPTFVEVGRAQKCSSSNSSHPEIFSDKF